MPLEELPPDEGPPAAAALQPVVALVLFRSLPPSPVVPVHDQEVLLEVPLEREGLAAVAAAVEVALAKGLIRQENTHVATIESNKVFGR